MPTKLWIPSSPGTSGFELVVCAVAKTTLTVTVAGPPPDYSVPGGGSELAHMTVSIIDGGALDFLGLTVSGSKRLSLYVGEFEVPDTMGPLLVRLERFGVEAFSGTATPLSASTCV